LRATPWLLSAPVSRSFACSPASAAHSHIDAEEIYVVLSGSGRVKLDDELINVGPLDSIRVAPATARAFEAGQDGLEFLAFGPHHPGDGEPVEDPWTDQ
jgi:mannose-6-phosphate isomerase-like protein (cupin superfamily)